MPSACPQWVQTYLWSHSAPVEPTLLTDTYPALRQLTSPPVVLSLSGAYLVLVAIVYARTHRSWSRYRSSSSVDGGKLCVTEELEALRRERASRVWVPLYNVVQVLVNVALAGWLALAQWRFHVHGKGGYGAAFWGAGEPHDWMTETGILAYLVLKYVDWTDTAVILVRRRWQQISFLHVYHHATVPLIFASAFQTREVYGLAYFVPFFNSVVHAVMYGYYGLRHAGVLDAKSPARRWVTRLQIGQFVLYLAQAAVIWQTRGRDYLWPTLYILSLLGLFAAFYVGAYLDRSRPAAVRRGRKISASS